jgi:hypothetical protein
MILNETKLRQIISKSVELGAKKALTEIGKLKPTISLNQAEKMYGAADMRRWINAGLIKGIKKGSGTSTIKFNRMELEILSKSDNLSGILGQALEQNEITKKTKI